MIEAAGSPESVAAITGTVAVGDAANGPYSVTLFAADGTYSAQTAFTWNVNSPVTITTPDDQSNTDGDTGLKHLTGLKRLRELYLYRTKVTDAGVAAPHEALPRVRIVR